MITKLILAAVTVGVCAADLANYNRVVDKGCSGRNEGGSFLTETLVGCSNRCDADSTCISFEYYFTGSASGKCQWSTTCTAALMTPTSDVEFYEYLRRGTCNKKADGAEADAVTNAECGGGFFATISATGICASAPCDMSVADDKTACCTAVATCDKKADGTAASAVTTAECGAGFFATVSATGA